MVKWPTATMTKAKADMKIAILIDGKWHEVWGLLSHTLDRIPAPQEALSIHVGDTLPDTVVRLTNETPPKKRGA